MYRFFSVKILAFETSCDDTSIALFEDEKLICMETASQIKIHNITGWVIILQIPIIPINHIQAHIFANFLEREEKEIQFPLVCLTVSGWHNDIYSMKDMWDLEKVGSTTDDASWEAFDKVAKMMWLGYPGGPIVSKLADEYAEEKIPGYPQGISLQSKNVGHTPSGCPDSNLIQAALQKWVKTVLLAGWVSANNRLKAEITKLAENAWLKFLHPVSNLYCMDNAAMVWILTYYRVKYGEFEQKVWVVKL